MSQLSSVTRVIMVAVSAFALSSCGGGGGGSASGGGGGIVAPPSVSGDMMALSASRGWNYQGNGLTISTYYNPTPVNGVTAFVGAAVNGSVTTILTSAQNMDNNLIGVLGIIPTASGNQVATELSAGSSAAVPGNPIIVPNSLTQGQTFAPSPGVTATGSFVGAVPGASACPSATTGATVQYAFQGQTRTVSYVPGCGITQYIGPTGATYTLVSVSTYPGIGQLAHARRIETLTLLDTAKSLLGLGRNAMPGAHVNP